MLDNAELASYKDNMDLKSYDKLRSYMDNMDLGYKDLKSYKGGMGRDNVESAGQKIYKNNTMVQDCKGDRKD